MSKLEAAISYLLDGYKKAHGSAGPPKDPELKTALYEAAIFLEAAGKVDKVKAINLFNVFARHSTSNNIEVLAVICQIRALFSAIPDEAMA